MRTLLLSTHDISGGAARAAYRLHKGLISKGVDSRMLVHFKESDDPTVTGPEGRLYRRYPALRQMLDNLPVLFYKRRETEIFSPSLLPEKLYRRAEAMEPDILNLHWVQAGLLSVEGIGRLKAPVVWTLHDMWAFTGGCHYDNSCGRYMEACGSCPQLKSGKERDLSRRVWERKKRAWQGGEGGEGLDLTIVTPSRWLSDCARKSSLFKDRRVEVIPNCVDTALYSPLDKKRAREALNLPVDRRLILFGAMEASSVRRKGFHLLQTSLRALSDMGFRDKAELVVFGASTPEDPPDFGLKANYVGRIDDDRRLSALYSASDVFVLPSLQDNLPNTVMEAFACGTPVAAFSVGGVSDMVEHRVNGYLARPLDPSDLAEGMAWILSGEERAASLGRNARGKALQEYTLKTGAERYLWLYEDVLKRVKRGRAPYA